MFFSGRFTQFLDAVYSFCFCVRVFPINEALKLPINISHKVKIGKIHKGAIRILGPIEHNVCFFGHQGYSAIAENQGLINIESGGQLIIGRNARFGQGIRLWIDSNAKIEIGDNFYCNKNCLFRAYDDIVLGNDNLLGWNIEINTSDGHTVTIDRLDKANHGSVFIGDHVWIGSHVTIGKNVFIASDSVVAHASVVASRFEESHILLGGMPARVLKTNVEWNQ